jgi:hypothetical protein
MVSIILVCIFSADLTKCRLFYNISQLVICRLMSRNHTNLIRNHYDSSWSHTFIRQEIRLKQIIHVATQQYIFHGRNIQNPTRFTFSLQFSRHCMNNTPTTCRHPFNKFDYHLLNSIQIQIVYYRIHLFSW